MKKGAFLVSIYFALICLFMACSSPIEEEESTEKQANIILILVDDLGWKDLQSQGSSFYKTPHIDKLFEAGFTFTNAYASASNCAPSRACLLSGQYTPRHGIYTVGSSKRGKSNLRKLIPITNKTILHDSVISIADELKNVGYTTASIGKWHIGEDPLSQGFDINIGGTKLGHPKSYFSPYKNKNLDDKAEGEYLTDRLTSEAIQFLENNKEEKFFLYLPYFTVHSPYQAKENLVSKYDSLKTEDGQNNAVYAGMVEALDKNIGRIIKALDSLNLSNETMVIFTSDNGGVSRISSQHPLKYGKGSYYEGGIRVPMMIKWPSKIEPKIKSDEAVINLDIYPTILSAAGISNQNSKILDGQSLMPLLMKEKEAIDERALFWHFPIYLQSTNFKFKDGRDQYFRTRPGSVIRKGKWKLHEYFEDGSFELYDLENDIGEEKNLVNEFPEIKKELYQLLNDWRMEVHADMPNEKNPDFGSSNNK